MKIMKYIIDYFTALLATILLLGAAIVALAIALPLSPLLAVGVAAWPYIEENYEKDKEMEKNGTDTNN